MKITTTYSSEDGERLYSCLMSEEEFSLFSKGTERQKKEKRKAVGSIAASGALLGTSVGLEIGANKYSKITKKELEKIANMHNQNENLLGRKIKVELSGFKDKKTKDFYKNVVEPKVNHVIESNNRGITRISKTAEKMKNKALLKGVTKGTLIGAGVGTATALGLKKIADKKSKK